MMGDVSSPRLVLAGLCLVLVVVMAVVLASYAFEYRIYPPDSDEGIHLVQGLNPALDAQAGQWKALARRLYFQRWYPPLYSVLLSAAFAFTGPSLIAARMINVALWALSLLVMTLIARSLCDDRAFVSGAVTLLLGATAPVPMLVSTLCMEESLAVLLSFSCVLSYVHARDPAPARHATTWRTGLLLAMVFLSRIPVALFLAGSLFVNEVLEGEWGKRKQLATRLVALLGPAVLVALAWLGHPDKLMDFLEYVQASVPRFPLFSKANLTHYPLVLMTMYVAAWPLAPWIVAATLTSLWQWWNRSVRLLLLMILVTIASLMVKRQVNPRFAILAAPALFILTGSQAGRAAQRLHAAPRWQRIAIAGLILLTLLSAAHPLHRRFATLPLALEVNYETDPEMTAIYAWVFEQVSPPDRRIVLINGWNQCSGAALEWYLSTADLGPARGTGEVIVRQFDLKDPSEEIIGRFTELLESQDIRYIVHLQGGPVSYAGAWWAYKAAIQDRITKTGEQSFAIHLWDGRVRNWLLRNQLSVEEAEEARVKRHYPVSIRATLFALSQEVD